MTACLAFFFVGLRCCNRGRLQYLKSNLAFIAPQFIVRGMDKRHEDYYDCIAIEACLGVTRVP